MIFEVRPIPISIVSIEKTYSSLAKGSFSIGEVLFEVIEDCILGQKI